MTRRDSHSWAARRAWFADVGLPFALLGAALAVVGWLIWKEVMT